MKELTLEEIKNISLEILQDVHAFCVKNDIHYSLASGTLLGAIRHKGFIPWDDDIDIHMPRSDYERFCEIYKSEKYQCLCAQKGGYWSAYARVCDMTDTVVVSPAPMGVKPNGVWIDLFPIDGAEEDEKTFQEHSKEAKARYDDLISRRFIKKLWFGGIRSKCKYIKAYLKGRCSVEKATEDYVACCKRIPYGSTSYVAGYSACVTMNPRRHRIELFKHFILTEFEGRKFYIIEGYDQNLRNIYGDYMQLPPKEKRVHGHSAHKYYWKNK